MKTYYDNGYRYFYDWHLQLWTIYKIDIEGNQFGDADYKNNRKDLIRFYPDFKFSIVL